MKVSFRSCCAAVLLATTSFAARAQSPTPAVVSTATDTARIVLNPALIHPVSLQSFAAFRTAVQPLIKQMAGKKIVALGEGTHGTAEFYRLRFWLTRILVEEHGFGQVALENTYGDSQRLDEALHQSTLPELKLLMQRDLLAMWQNREMADMLAWMQAHNRRHRRQVHLAGIDAMFAQADARYVHEQLAARNPSLRPLAEQLVKSAAYQDSVWMKMSDKSFKFPYKKWMASGLAGYAAANDLLQALPAAHLPRRARERLALTLLNSRMAFDEAYQVKTFKRESSRDSVMAEMAKLLVRQPGSKLIIWAHDAHVSRLAALEQGDGDDNGGGTGGFLERAFPGQYFVLGTSTAAGTFAATTNPFISPSSVMTAYPLQKPTAGSWEASLSYVAAPGFFFDTHALGAQNLKRPHRVVGQTPDSQTTYAHYRLADAYDAFFFLRQTSAATPL